MTTLSRAYPFINKALAQFSARRPLHEIAIEAEEIHPAETTILSPVLMLEGDWDRVTDVQEETTWDAERKRTQGGEFQSQATIRYTFENVLATPWGCYKLGRSFRQAGKVDMGQLMRAPIVHREAGYFGLPVAGMQYFGHWLRDGLPASLLRRPHEDLYFPINPSWHHAKAYSDLLKIDRLIDPLVFFDRLSVCIDIGQNRNRQDRIRTIHRAIQSKLPPPAAPAAPSSGVARPARHVFC